MLLTGKAYWAKIAGNPVQNRFNPAVPQWSFDLSLNDEEVQKLLQAGVPKTTIKDKGDERGQFVTFKRDAKKKDNSDAKPFYIVDAHNNVWPKNKEVGNGSILNVKVALNERTYQGKKFLKPSAVAIQVWDLVEFTRSDFPVREGEPLEDFEDSPAISSKPGKKANTKTTQDW